MENRIYAAIDLKSFYDVVEDTDMTFENLLTQGIPKAVVDALMHWLGLQDAYSNDNMTLPWPLGGVFKPTM